MPVVERINPYAGMKPYKKAVKAKTLYLAKDNSHLYYFTGIKLDGTFKLNDPNFPSYVTGGVACSLKDGHYGLGGINLHRLTGLRKLSPDLINYDTEECETKDDVFYAKYFSWSLKIGENMDDDDVRQVLFDAVLLDMQRRAEELRKLGDERRGHNIGTA